MSGLLHRLAERTLSDRALRVRSVAPTPWLSPEVVRPGRVGDTGAGFGADTSRDTEHSSTHRADTRAGWRTNS